MKNKDTLAEIATKINDTLAETECNLWDFIRLFVVIFGTEISGNLKERNIPFDYSKFAKDIIDVCNKHTHNHLYKFEKENGNG